MSGEKEIYVSRQLRGQLQQASVITKKYAGLALYDVNTRDIEKLDLSTFAKDLILLSELGFEAESLRIEKKVMSLMPEGQKRIFQAEMNKSLVPRDAAVKLATAKAEDSN